jgi:hypothetical protein
MGLEGEEDEGIVRSGRYRTEDPSTPKVLIAKFSD